MNQTSSKIRSKMDQKSIKNRSKSRFGRLQGRFGGVLGRLGRSKASLEASWSVLEASWRPLGRAWAEKGGQHGSNLALKTEPKSLKNRSKNRSKNLCLQKSIFGGFWWILGAKMEPNLWQNRFQNRCELHIVIFRNGTSLANAKIGSGGRKWDEKSMKNQ